MKPPKLVLLFLFMAHFSYAVNYYVASNGNDSNTGTSLASPWQTLAKVSSISHTLVAGDSVFFRRGDTFLGTLKINKPAQGNASKYIYYGAYGTGANPLFKGTKNYTTWTPSALGADMWETNIATGDYITQLFSGNTELPISRFPKTGLAITPSAMPNQFTLISATINRPFGYWVGSNVLFRGSKYAWFERTITYSNGDTIRFSIAASWDDFSKSSGWGFYIESKPQEITLEQEWGIDTVAKKLYIKSAVNPNTLNLEGSAIPNGIELPDGSTHRRYTTIQNIDFVKYATYGISSIQNRDINILNCGFYDNYEMGFWYRMPSGGAANVNIENCIFQRSRWAAFRLHNTHIANIKNNYISDIEYGRAMDFTGSFSLMYNVTIERNVIKNAGGYGISFYGGPFYIRKNVIDNVAYEISDAAAVMCYQSGNGTVVEDNFISNTKIGNSGIPAIFPNYGIYYDEDSYNITTRRNTIYNSLNGLLFNNGCKNMVVENNTFFNNTNNQLQVQRVTINGDTGRIHENIAIRKNVFFANSNIQRTMVINVTYPFTNRLTLDSNYHINPFRNASFLWLYSALSGSAQLSFARIGSISTIQDLSGQEANGKTMQLNWTYLKNITATGSNMITNSDFSTNINNWSNFPSGILSHDVSAATGSALKITPTQNTHLVFTTPGNMSLPINQSYRVRLKHYTNSSGNAVMRLAAYSLFRGGNATPVEYFNLNNQVIEDTLYITCNRTISFNSRLQFDVYQSNGTVWLDDVFMEPITADTTSLKDAAQIFVNPSDTVLTVSLNGKTYFDLDSNFICGNSITLQPWSSRILIEQMLSERNIHTHPDSNAITKNQTSNCAWYLFEQSNRKLLAIHPQNNNLGAITTKTYNHTHTITANNRKLMKRSWKISTTNAPTTGVMVRLYFTENDFNTLQTETVNLTDISKLVVLKYHGNNEDSKWDNNTSGTWQEISNADFVPFQNGYYAEFTVNEFSEFWISHDTTLTSPLSVHLLDFRATQNKQNVKLNWLVQSQSPNYFNVEKSVNAVKWEKIGTVTSGNVLDNKQTTYEFIDHKPIKGLQYYRLHMKDEVSVWGYSPIRTVYFSENANNIQVFPNPVSDELLITVSQAERNAVIRLINTSGQQVYQGNMNGNTTQNISLKHLKAGIYLLQVQTEQQLHAQKIIKID